ncbi:MAG: hypothetical protein R3C30_01080 [Hyphomonadaceae bacterium]
MSVCDVAKVAEVGALSGLELQHDFYLTVGDWSAWHDVSARLVGAGVELHSLQVSRQNGGLSVRCRIKKVSSEGARELSNALLNEGLAQSSTVEHLMLARAQDAAS